MRGAGLWGPARGRPIRGLRGALLRPVQTGAVSGARLQRPLGPVAGGAERLGPSSDADLGYREQTRGDLTTARRAGETGGRDPAEREHASADAGVRGKDGGARSDGATLRRGGQNAREPDG